MKAGKDLAPFWKKERLTGNSDGDNAITIPYSMKSTRKKS